MTRMVWGLGCLHLVGSLLAILLLAGPVGAIDITGCGQTVPAGQMGVLTADLLCPRLPEGNPPAVSMENRSTLSLNGHTIVAPQNVAVVGAAPANPKGRGARYTVLGPGEITGSGLAIQGAAVAVNGVNIHDNFNGVNIDKLKAMSVSIVNSTGPAINGGGLGIVGISVLAHGLTVTGAMFDGIFVRTIRGDHVVASGNGPGQPTNGIGFGIVADKIRLSNLTAMNNDGNGVHARVIRLRDSTVTGNTGQDTGDIDVFADTMPLLHNTICGKSNGWHVCQNDSPSGAFLDGAEN